MELKAIPTDDRVFIRIIPTETGFDVKIPDGITMTEAALIFVQAVERILEERKPA